jgi:orotate phosphoribosyltransferase
MSEIEAQLLRLIRERAFGQDGPYRLASGAVSNYYIDGKMVEVFSRSARLIGEVLYERTRALKVDAIGGLEVGAVPLTAAAVVAYDLHGQQMEGFWVRDEVKRHGTQKLIEGKLQPGSRVVIIDDVVTQGGLDRLVGAEQRIRDAGVPAYETVFTVRDLGVNPDDTGASAAAVG